MKRRSVLALCSTALLSIAGCLSGSAETSDQESTSDRGPTSTDTSTQISPTATASPTPPQTPTSLPNRTISFPDGPKSPPVRPPDFSLRTAIRYVRQFHYRATYNQIWDDETSGAKLSCRVLRAAQRGSVFRVVIRCSSALNVDTHANSTGDTQLLGRTYVYLLDDDSLIRRLWEKTSG